MNTETPNNPEDKKTTATDGAAPNAQQPAANPSDAAAAFAAGNAAAATPKSTDPDPVQSHRDAVEAGRLKKMSDELKAEREKNAELQRKLAEAEKLSRTQKLKDLAGYQAMDEAGRELVDKLVEMRGGGDDGSERYKAELEEIRRNQAAMAAAAAQDNAARAQTDAFKALEQSHPGLLHRIGKGDLKDAWTAFLGRTDDYAGRTYDEIVAGANARGNGAALVRVVQEFVRTSGLERQYQKLAGSPRPAGAPAATATGTDAGGKHVYQSLEEIYSKMDEARAKERRGQIDRETRRKIIAELEAAEDEGRYLKQ